MDARSLTRVRRDRRDTAPVSVKFGALRSPDGGWIGIDTRPAAVRSFAVYSLTRLGLDHIDVYRPGWLDPSVPIEETVGAIADLVKAGYVRTIGLSEVGAETIRRAHAAHEIADLQIEYSLISRGPEAKIFPLSPSWASEGPMIVPLVGARTRQQLEKSLGALDVTLSAEDVARLEAAVPATAVAGTRYDEHQMRILDSERR